MTEMFWAKVEKTETCWLWVGWKNRKGYGRFKFNGRLWVTSRLAYTLKCGPIPDGMCVCHHCDRPACVRPDHLFLGANADNMQDMLRKGRQRRQITSAQDHFSAGHAPRGADGSGAKLTEQQACEILQKRRSGIMTKDLANEYGINRATIQRVVSGQTWRGLVGRAAPTAEEDQT